MNNSYKKHLAVLLGVFTLWFATPAQAQLRNDKLVAPQFLSWDATWSKLSAAQRQQLAWVPKAKSVPWTVNDAAFVATMKQIDAQVKRQGDVEAVFEKYGRKAQVSPSALNRFAYGYAAWKKYIRQGATRFREVTPAVTLMAQNYVPSYQYTRVLFLLPQTYAQAPPRVFEPVGQRLLKRDSKDHYVGLEMVKWLSAIPTGAARKQATALIQRYLAKAPKEPYYWRLRADLLDGWWRNNENIANAAKTSVDKQQAMSLAKRDARAAVTAYQHSIALSPADSLWRKEYGPSLVKRITDWLQRQS